MSEDRLLLAVAQQIPHFSLHNGWNPQKPPIPRLGEAMSSIKSLLMQLEPTSKSINNTMSYNPPMTVSEVIREIPEGTDTEKSFINGGIRGIARPFSGTSKDGKPYHKLALEDEKTGEKITAMLFKPADVEDGQLIAITGQGVYRKPNNVWKNTITPQFGYGAKAFVQVLGEGGESDFDPVPQKSNSKKSSTQPTAGFHEAMKANSLLMAHAIIYAHQTLEAVASVKPKLAEILNNAEGLRNIGISLCIEANRQGLNKDVPPLTIQNVNAKRVTAAMQANLEDAEGNPNASEDVPF